MDYSKYASDMSRRAEELLSADAQPACTPEELKLARLRVDLECARNSEADYRERYLNLCAARNRGAANFRSQVTMALGELQETQPSHMNLALWIEHLENAADPDDGDACYHLGRLQGMADILAGGDIGRLLDVTNARPDDTECPEWRKP